MGMPQDALELGLRGVRTEGESHTKPRSCYSWLQPRLAKRRQRHEWCLLAQLGGVSWAPWVLPHGTIINGAGNAALSTTHLELHKFTKVAAGPGFIL